jgi:hypothetical protein
MSTMPPPRRRAAFFADGLVVSQSEALLGSIDEDIS